MVSQSTGRPGDWHGMPVPPIRHELRFGDRVVACFADRPGSVHALLVEAVGRNPGGDALVDGTERLSWADLDARVARAAAGLRTRGIGAGDRVALLLGNRTEFVVTLFAALRLGAIAVPLNVRQQTPELLFALNDCGAKLLVHEPDMAGRLPDPTALPALAHRVAVGGAGAEPFAALLDDGAVAVPEPVAEEDTAVILYTSGTTGRPKGAMLSHLNIVHSAMHYEVCMGLTSADRSVLAVPASHVTGLAAMIVAMARCTGALVLMPAFKAADFLALAARERMTHTVLVPAMYNLCLLQPDFDRYDLSAWRVGAYGGAPMPPATIEALARKLPGLNLMNAYGATETTSPTTMVPFGWTEAKSGTVGAPVPCAEVRVMDEEGREVPVGEGGEVWIRGPMVVRGYWNRPDANAADFAAGFWRSGDIGSMDADGFLRVFDRRKDVINRGGYKIFSTEVENVLAAHPDVVEAAVVARPCEILGERVHAFVTRSAAGATAEALAAFCARRLSDYKVPETFTIRDTPLPRNANGKLVKTVLRDEVMATLGPERARR